MRLTGRHRATSKAVFADPVRSNVVWSDVGGMLVGCGAEVEAGRGGGPEFASRCEDCAPCFTVRLPPEKRTRVL